MSAVRPPKSGLVDLVAVRRCDRAFDALAARRDAHFDDPAVRLLSALVVDVDADIPRVAPTDEESAEDEWRPALAPIRAQGDLRSDDLSSRVAAGRGGKPLFGARAALAASVVVAALTTTGVAAANIGHFEQVGQVLGISGQPAPSAAEQVEDALVTAGGLIDEGRYADARRALRVARERAVSLRGAEETALAAEIEHLEARLARESSSQRATTHSSHDQGDASAAPNAGAGESPDGTQLPKVPDAIGKAAGGATGGQPDQPSEGRDGGNADAADGSGSEAPLDTSLKVPAGVEPDTGAPDDRPRPQPKAAGKAGSAPTPVAGDGDLVGNGNGKGQGKGKVRGGSR